MLALIQSDMEVVASSPGQKFSTVTDAKRFACEAAASCYVYQAAGAEATCQPGVGSPVVFETIKRPPPLSDWRRQVACNHARAGNVPSLTRSGTNKATVVETKIVATASRDGITRNADRTVSESSHVCWSPPVAGQGRPPGERADRQLDPGKRTGASQQPKRTDAGHQPTRTSGLESIDVAVTPGTQQGKCPASVLMRATVKVRQPIDPQPGLRDQMIQAQGGATRAPVHEGYFQLWLETAPREGKSLPLGRSEQATFTVDCNPAAPTGLKNPG
jgi:hypothetical protein